MSLNNYLILQTLYCKYCGKKCKNLNSLKQHECRCKENPNRIITKEYKNKLSIAVKRGLIKYKESNHKTYNNANKIEKIEEYNKNPKLCLQCNKPLAYQQFKYGQKFCCGKCSNLSRPSRSEESKKRTSESLKQYNKTVCRIKKAKDIKKIKTIKKVKEKHPHTNIYFIKCIVCGKLFVSKYKEKKTCSKECHYKTTSLANKTRYHDTLNLKSWSKKGIYKNISCDSSWELAFLIYCLDHNINIKRNKNKFKYQIDNKSHFYYPDFIINNDTYIEIKGRKDKTVEYKNNCMKDLNLKFQMIDSDKINKYIKYVKYTYNIKNIWDLYDIKYF